MEILFKKNHKVELRKSYRRSPTPANASKLNPRGNRTKFLKYHSITGKTAGKSIARRIPTVVTYPIAGTNKVECISYQESAINGDRGLVQINSTQYFDNVPVRVWNYCPGNYCICQEWLQEREGTILNHQNIQDYQRLILLVSETLNLVSNVDARLSSSTNH